MGPKRAIDGPERAIDMPDRAIDGSERAIDSPERAIDSLERAIGLPDAGSACLSGGVGTPDWRVGLPGRRTDLPDRRVGSPDWQVDLPDRAWSEPPRRRRLLERPHHPIFSGDDHPVDRSASSRAKLISAEVANAAAQALFLRQDWEGHGALFCIAYKKEMTAMSKARYREHGVTVSSR